MTSTEAPTPPPGPQTAGQEPGSSAPSESKATKGDTPRPKAPLVSSVGQLLRELYGGKLKRVALKKPEVKALRAAPPPSDEERIALLDLAQADRTMEKTRQLLMLAVRLDDVSLAGRLREFARDVLRRQPAFRTDSLAGVLENLPEAPTEEKAISILASLDIAALAWPEGAPTPLTKKQLHQCRANAIHCLVLILFASRATPIERLHRYLQSSLWASAARRYRTTADRLCALLTSKDPAIGSLTFGLLERESLEHGQRADAALRAEARAITRASQLEERLATVEQELTEARAERNHASTQLEQATQARSVAEAHLKDDYEQLRGHVLRRLNEEVSLLDEGLHALQRDPPKVHVMVDHAERAIDGLKREIARLRGNG